MFEMTNELVIWLRKFQKEFGDIVPLREIPASMSTDELIEIVKLSIEKKENLIPAKLGLDNLEKNQNIDI